MPRRVREESWYSEIWALRSPSIKQDKLSEEVGSLKTRNVELEDHNAELEAELARLAQDSVHNSAVAHPQAERGNPAPRGTAHQRKKTATRNVKRGMRVVESPEPTIVPASEVQVGEKIAVDLALAVATELKEYEIEIKSAKRALQNEVSRGFREVIGVPGTLWPDLTIERSNEITGEVYMNPLFEATVQHAQNHQLFSQVVKWRERRVTKAKQLEKAVVPFAAKRLVSPQVIKDAFVHEQYMSDEASGPEDNSEINKAVWETRMALKRGYEHADDVRYLTRDAKDCLRSSHAYAEKKYERVRGTGRQSLRVPNRAPFNFGINMAWFDKYKDHPDYSALLEDWGQHPDPEGFGTSLLNGEDNAGNADEDLNVEDAMAEEH
ncbi:hypothetical protein B0H13DRAFT_1854963 [Mycena leptocephala]|nr:hypothetical protein B0H13DRAFT_1854963 [Mycena leptocephala]